MFDTMKVGQQIRAARIARNMTQMNLADAMEVSYQAVSNWELGNSMPDISKIQKLCTVLDINAEKLLGMGGDTDTVKKMIETDGDKPKEMIPMKEMKHIIPIIPPDASQEIVEESIRREEKIELSHIIELAPFLDRDTLGRLAEKYLPEQIEIGLLHELAPFLRRETVDNIAEHRLPKEIDFGSLVELAPFLSRDGLGRLAEKHLPEQIEIGLLHELAPFLRKEIVDNIAEHRLSKEIDFGSLVELAPFLSRDGLGRLAEKHMAELANLDTLMELAPFLGKETLARLLER